MTTPATGLDFEALRRGVEERDGKVVRQVPVKAWDE